MLRPNPFSCSFNNGKKMEGVRNQQPKWVIFRISKEKDLEQAKKNW